MITINYILSKLKIYEINLKDNYKCDFKENKKKEIIEDIQRYYYKIYLEKVSKEKIESLKKDAKYISYMNKLKISNFSLHILILPFLISIGTMWFSSEAMFSSSSEKESYFYYSLLSYMIMSIIFASSAIIDNKIIKNRYKFIKDKINFKEIIKEITLDAIKEIPEEEYSLKEKIVSETYFLEKNEKSIFDNIIEIILENKEKENDILNKKILKKENKKYETELNFLRNKNIKEVL